LRAKFEITCGSSAVEGKTTVFGNLDAFTLVQSTAISQWQYGLCWFLTFSPKVVKDLYQPNNRFQDF